MYCISIIIKIIPHISRYRVRDVKLPGSNIGMGSLGGRVPARYAVDPCSNSILG